MWIYSVYRASGSPLRPFWWRGIRPTAHDAPGQQYRQERDARRFRRSAMYASLNWKHGDINDFLEMKNWDDMKVGDTTIAALKQADFNYQAPMDMTNISVNYDTEWQDNYWRTGEVGDVFMKNIRQALKTSEPGFSFNYMKDSETLRNACTEVTSSDPDDVCNLGSVNLSRISDITEFADVVFLATKFLNLRNHSRRGSL